PTTIALSWLVVGSDTPGGCHAAPPLESPFFFSRKVLPGVSPAAILRENSNCLKAVVSIGGFMDLTHNRSLQSAIQDDGEDLPRSEKRFRILIENNADAIALTDANGIVTYANPSTRRVLGYLPEELVGRN